MVVMVAIQSSQLSWIVCVCAFKKFVHVFNLSFGSQELEVNTVIIAIRARNVVVLI